LLEFDTDRLLAVEQDAGGHRPRFDGEVRPLHRRVEIGDCGRVAATVLRGELKEADPFLVAVVEVRLVGNAGFDAGFDQRGGDRVLFGKVADVERPAGAVEIALAAFLVLALAEVGQNVVPAPPARAHLRPVVIVRRLAAHVEHAVDRGGAAEHFALGPLVLAAPRTFVDFGLVEPVYLGVVQRLAEADRGVDHDVGEKLARLLERSVIASGFEQDDLVLAAFGEPRRQHASGAAGTYHHIVRVEIRSHYPLLLTRCRAWCAIRLLARLSTVPCTGNGWRCAYSTPS